MGLLSRYLIRQYGLWIVIVTGGFGAIAMLGDFLEMLRFANRFELGAAAALIFTLQRLPLLLIDLLPFIFLFASVFCLLRLSQAQELAVIRAAGLSVWQFLRPLLSFTFVMAIFIICVIEPLGVHTNTLFSERQSALTQNKPRLSLTAGGVWFRENSDSGNYFIRADKLDPDNASRLLGIDVTIMTAEGAFAGRLSAASGILRGGAFELRDVEQNTGQETRRYATYQLPTGLKQDNLQAGFKPPRAVSLWQLPRYIEEAGLAGIDVTRHEARFQSLLALPGLLLAMVMVAACFSLPTGRMFSTGQTLGLSVLCGFGLFLFNDFIGLMGELDILPAFLAGWMPAIIALLLSVSYLLTTEDG